MEDVPARAGLQRLFHPAGEKYSDFFRAGFALVRLMMQLRQTQTWADAREYRAKLALCFQRVLVTDSRLLEVAGGEQ